MNPLKVMAIVASGLKTQDTKPRAAMSPELFATEKACRLVEKGMPFRQAYKKIAEGLSNQKD